MPRRAEPTIEQRAVHILFDTYWSPSGWKAGFPPPTDPQDFALARRAGVMFDPVVMTHDELVRTTIAAVRALNRRCVADAFVVSLRTRRVELRSAMGSFAVFQHFSRHAGTKGEAICAVCGESTGRSEYDINVLNFERLKWGGVRHDSPAYARLDLELFRKLPAVAPEAEDVACLEAIVRAIKAAPARATPMTLQAALARAFPSTKEERQVVIDILGYSGILATSKHPGYRRRFVRVDGRLAPPRLDCEVSYPACWWRGADGINERAFHYWFGHLL